jgi:hypothetical protein
VKWTAEDARRVQRHLGLGRVHVVYVGSDGFAMAHTDAERASATDLRSCRHHYWLGKLGDPEWWPYIWDIREPGWYSLEGLTPGSERGLAL